MGTEEILKIVLIEMRKRGIKFKDGLNEEMPIFVFKHPAVNANDIMAFVDRYRIPTGIKLPWGLSINP